MKLRHGMLLDSKSVIDDALPDLEQLLELIPDKLHPEFHEIISRFEEVLCSADVSDEYEEKS